MKSFFAFSNGTEEKGGSAQKPLTNVRTGWISPTEERDHLNIEKLQHVPALICYNAHSLLSKNGYMRYVIQINLRNPCVSTLKKSVKYGLELPLNLTDVIIY